MSRMTSLRAPSARGRAPRCAADPDRMFPIDESERPGACTPGEARALQVCALCPVLAECRMAVLGLDGSAPLASGVAGGMTREDRRAVRATSRRLAREVTVSRAARLSGSAAGSTASDAGWEAA